jgi:hypothetical protein
MPLERVAGGEDSQIGTEHKYGANLEREGGTTWPSSVSQAAGRAWLAQFTRMSKRGVSADQA